MVYRAFEDLGRLDVDEEPIGIYPRRVLKGYIPYFAPGSNGFKRI
jgi:hypothetical protein